MRLRRMTVLPVMVCATILFAQEPLKARIDVLDSCPVTTKGDSSFMPPSKYLQEITTAETFWYGSKELWTHLGSASTWDSERQPANPGVYVNKLVYWRERSDWRAEPEKLRVTARRLDQEAPVVVGSPAHEVFVIGPMPPAMMSGITIPASGCWEITASFRDHKLSFVRKVLIQGKRGASK